MAKLRLNDARVKSLEPGEYFDELLPGFGLRVRSGGSRTFFVRYRSPVFFNGEGKKQNQRRSLGRYPDISLKAARRRAREVLERVEYGEDPAAEGVNAAGAMTFAELAEEYLERHAKVKKREKSWREDLRKLRKDLLPVWGRRGAAEISRRDVVVVLDAIVDRGAGVEANRVRALVSTIFNFGISRGLLETNPCHLLPRPAQESPREYVLTDGEIRKLWHGLDSEPSSIARGVRLLLLTGQRSGEVLGMRWDQLDEDLWILPPKATKNGREHVVPLSSQALAQIPEIRATPEDGGIVSCWVFPSRDSGAQMSRNALSKAMRRLRDQHGLGCRPHDLRRTVFTRIVELGFGDVVAHRVANHSPSGLTRVYNRYDYLEEKREALAAWGDRVEEIVGARQ